MREHYQRGRSYMHSAKNIGQYKSYSLCRFCFSDKVETVINLGMMPLAGGFLKSKRRAASEKYYPLELIFCTDCFLLQTSIVIDQDILFKNYFYFSSTISTLVEHFKKTALDLRGNDLSEKFIVEIGCNDGSLIKACLDQGWKALGVDPATNIVRPLIQEGLPILNNYFTEKIAGKIIAQYGKADIIFSSNTLAHIEDMHDVFKGIKNLLKEEGILVFDVHYLGNLIEGLQYDMIYHEHQYYYSLHTIKNMLLIYNMEVFDVDRVSIHAGSIRFYVKHKQNKRKIEKRVSDLLQEEAKKGLTQTRTFKNFEKDIKKTKKDILELLKKLKKQKKNIAGYGASGRGTIVMNYCELDGNVLEYVIDDAPVKQGTYTPGNHLKIVSSAVLHTQKKPDYVIVFAWSFIDEIKKRNKAYLDKGGKFILPLPKVTVVDR